MTGYATEAERRHAVFCLDQALASHKLEGIDPSPLAMEYRAKIKAGQATIDDWIRAARRYAQDIANETKKPAPLHPEIATLIADVMSNGKKEYKPLSKWWLLVCVPCGIGWSFLLMTLLGIKLF